MLSCSLSMCLSACACLHVLVTPAEFARTVVNYLDDGEDEELRERLRNAWVFHTIFENGTSLRQHEQEGLHAVGIRMLYQLLREDFDAIMDKYRAPDPEVFSSSSCSTLGVCVRVCMQL